MFKEDKDLVTISFDGARFAGHALDVDVLPELTAYKKLLIETAIEIWRKRNPSKRRLPKGFRDNIVLKFYELREGSTSIPLVREVELFSVIPLPLEAEELDEIDEAALVIDKTIRIANEGGAPPDDLPSTVIPLFVDFGKTLKADEFIQVKRQKEQIGPRYDTQTQKFILEWRNPTYEKPFSLTGEVRATSIDATSFRLRLEDGRTIGGKYSASEESKILEALKLHEQVRLVVTGIVEFYCKDDIPKRFSRVESIDIASDAGADTLPVDDGPLWKKLLAIGSSVSPKSWDSVPSDLSSNIDSYLYGKSKDS